VYVEIFSYISSVGGVHQQLNKNKNKMKTQKTNSEIQNRIDELKNKLEQASDINLIINGERSTQIDEVWSEEEMDEFVHLIELKEMLENLEISK
jgi:GTPase SAR1 family protein